MFQSLGFIGRTSHGFALAARNRVTGQVISLKLVPRGYEVSTAKQILRELVNHWELSQSKHPHVAELMDVFMMPRYLCNWCGVPC